MADANVAIKRGRPEGTPTKSYKRGQYDNQYSGTGWELLAERIIVGDASEYRNYLRLRKYAPNHSVAKSKIKSCERFFRSDWYRTLTTIPGEYLIEALKQEIRDEKQPMYGVGSKEWLERNKEEVYK